MLVGSSAAAFETYVKQAAALKSYEEIEKLGGTQPCTGGQVVIFTSPTHPTYFFVRDMARTG